MIHKFPLNGKWVVASDEELAKVSDATRELALQREFDATMNPLGYFLPHGIPWSNRERVYGDGVVVVPPSEYKKEYENDGCAFVNDHTSDYSMLVAPRKTGKSYHGAAWIGLRGLKCDPNWPCFTEGNVEYREWTGPKTAVVSSFSWANVGELWKVYQEVLPRDELGPYAADWGKYPGETGRQKNLSFISGRTGTLVTQKSKLTLIFLCYTQRRHVWENFKANMLHADEQIPLALLRAWQDGTRTMGDYTPACFTLSGFCLPDRPDTGEAGELKRGIWDGKRTRGKIVGRYHLDVPSTPDAIMTKKKKKAAYDEYANPAIERSSEDTRRAEACWYPGWERGGGMVFGPDVWTPKIHVIAPLWDDDKTPTNLTKWRVVDYAPAVGINVCTWLAVGPKRAVAYRCLYERGLEICEFAEMIILQSHNRQVREGEIKDERTGSVHPTFREEQIGEQFYGGTIIDSRSLAQVQNNETLEEIFGRYGISDARAACGQRDDIQLPRLRDWLRIDYKADHPWHKNIDGTPMKGCPRFYVFDGRCTELVAEIEGLRKPDPTKPIAPHQMWDKRDPHHGTDTLKWFASDGPCWMGDEPKEEEDEERSGNRFTGY